MPVLFGETMVSGNCKFATIVGLQCFLGNTLLLCCMCQSAELQIELAQVLWIIQAKQLEAEEMG